MKYGMLTLIENENIENCTELCKELNLDFIELNMNLPDYQTDKMDISKLKSICENEGIFFTIHLDENINICDFNKININGILGFRNSERNNIEIYI